MTSTRTSLSAQRSPTCTSSVSVHPFRDHNGRVSRITQSLALARERLLSPEFASVEEYLGEHIPDYYKALQQVQGGRYRDDAGRRMGDEFIGVVEDVGSDVASVKAGDLVVSPFLWSDGSCVFCREGLQSECLHGSNDVDGGQCGA